MAAEIHIAATAVAHVRVELGRGQIRVAEHLLDAAQVGAALEEMSRERVAQQVGMDAPGLEPRALGEAAEDQEGAGAGQRASLRVQEELRPVATVEIWASVRQVAPQRVRRVAADRHDPLLAALAGTSDEAALQVDVGLAEAHRLADA